MAFGGRLRRNLAYFAALFSARGRAVGPHTIEIAYDPIGLFYSDFVPRRPFVRIAHLHELLGSPDSYLERRLCRSIHSYDRVVVADRERALHTQETLRLDTAPIAIENYPLLGHRPRMRKRTDPQAPFEVIYCGSLGYTQNLDMVIESITKWPEQASLTLIGRDETPIARQLANLAQRIGVANRVRFTGWMDLVDAEARLTEADLGIAVLESKSYQCRTALGASNKRYQYMKAGLPQIGDQNPGVPELIQENGVGVCVPEEDVDALASAVRLYASNPGRCIEEGARAFELHQQRFHYERVFRRLLDTLN
jgi:glycosyltransferase involved in cell wall biosynthesis